MAKRGMLIVLSGPSGVGKGTVKKLDNKRYLIQNQNVSYVVNFNQIRYIANF